MGKTMTCVLARALSAALLLVLWTGLAQADPWIVGNTASFGGGRIVTFDFANGATVDFFVPDGAFGQNGRGVVLYGSEVYYTELSGPGFGPTDLIRVAPFNGGAGGPDFRTLPNPRPGAGIQALAVAKGVLYVLTGDGSPGTSPARVYKLDVVTGKVLGPPVDLSGTVSPTADGFTVLPNGNFLVNTELLSCDYIEVFSTGANAGTPTGNSITVPGTTAASACTGVDTDEDSNPTGPVSLFFFTEPNSSDNGITQTDLNGVFIARTVVEAGNNIKDISLLHPCPACDLDSPEEVVVNTTVTANFNTATPTCTGNAVLCSPSVFSFVKPDPTKVETWKAIFTLGTKKLRVAAGGTITTARVPPNGNNQKAPGLEIRSSCCLTVDEGGGIIVQSRNQPGGELRIRVDGPVVINGKILDGVIETNGPPGQIIIETCCGGIVTGPKSRIETIGDKHGSNITLAACCIDGNIELHGLIDASYKTGTPATVNIAAMNGTVLIDGTNSFGFINDGTLRRVMSGVGVRSRRDPIPGFINIQAAGDITVTGHTFADAYGAVSAKTVSNAPQGGIINARSLTGQIVATNRAFDNANRFNANGVIDLQAAADILLSVTAGPQPVVSVQGGDAGTGGTNRLRSFSGMISVGTNASVLANFVGRPGTNGKNFLTACDPIVISGTVNPPPQGGGSTGVCSPPVPEPLFIGCSEAGLIPFVPD